MVGYAMKMLAARKNMIGGRFVAFDSRASPMRNSIDKEISYPYARRLELGRLSGGQVGLAYFPFFFRDPT